MCQHMRLTAHETDSTQHAQARRQQGRTSTASWPLMYFCQAKLDMEPASCMIFWTAQSQAGVSATWLGSEPLGSTCQSSAADGQLADTCRRQGTSLLQLLLQAPCPW